MRLFVDCDNTLVLWLTPEKDVRVTPIINVAVVKFVKDWLKQYPGSVTIWATGSEKFAIECGKKCFGANANLYRYSIKSPIAPQPGDVFLDDRPLFIHRKQALKPQDINK